ncbi:unnamed protein product [Paramecium sonneborni]|uniref:Cyclic nucleotide-binding domain-containing protein n=1 Tax=Paramecium sonneborni TaxID=65129 RepID=A0A8S1MIK5_9CILI|nr:unnamed protein product [Paramecium sonneborni]
MSSQKITDYKILQVITKKSKVNDKILKKGNDDNTQYVPMRSVKLIHPQQPQDNQQNDMTIIPEEFRGYQEAIQINQSVERNQALICDLKQEMGFSIYDTKYLKRANTDINFNDLTLYFLQSMKLFKQDKNSKNLGKLTNKLLQDKNKGNNINFPSYLSKNVNILYFFTIILHINNISILLLNSMFCLFKNNFNILFIELLQIITLSINCIYNWQKYRNDLYDKLQFNKQQQYRNIIFNIIQIILIVLLGLIIHFQIIQEYLIICLILLNMITIEQLSQTQYMLVQESMIKLILLSFQQCHLYCCAYLILVSEDFNFYNFDEQLHLYLTIYLRFFGYMVGIDLSLQNIDSNIEIIIFILYTWIIFLIIKYKFVIQLYLLVQVQKTNFKDRKNMIDFLNFLKSLNISSSKIRKLFNKIQQQQVQQRSVGKIKNYNFLLNLYGIKESLRQQIIYQDKMKHLRQFNLFNKLSRQSLSNLTNIIEIQYYRNEEIIINQDELDDCSIYIIKSGQVEISFKNSKNGMIGIKLLGINECFGQIGFLTGLARSASVRSIGESCIYKLERSNFQQIIQNNNNDKELVNVIRNEIIFSNEYGIVGMKCYNCQCSNHLIQNCPQLHLEVQKELVILDLLAPSDQKRHKFKRRDAKSSNTKFSALNTQVKCQEFQEDQGYASSLGETDHTNYQQNQSHYTITQSSINYPSKILGQKLSLRPSTIENLQALDIQEQQKEQQFREIDQIFIRASNPKGTTSTAGFGYKEQSSQKSPKTENINNIIDEQPSEDSSVQSSSFSDDQISRTSKQTLDQKLRPMKSSNNNRSEKYSQYRSGVSSISINNTPKHSQLSILNTFTLKSDMNNNVQLSGGTNHGSQKMISTLHLRDKEDRQNTLTIPGGNNNMLQVPSKRSLINPLSQLNYEMSPFVAFPQHHPPICNELQWSPIEIDKYQIFNTFYPQYNVDVVIDHYHMLMKNYKDTNTKRVKSNINELFKFNTF